MTPVEAGQLVARRLFAKRGNHSEIHLREEELAAVIALGVEVAASRAYLTVTRTSDRFYKVVDASRPMTDGEPRHDDRMVLDGDVLKSYEERGHIRTGGLMKVVLGPRSLFAVSGLAVGETVRLEAPAGAGGVLSAREGVETRR